MTKEEAIKQLDGADIAVLNRDFFKFNQAIIMAISALRTQQKQENECIKCSGIVYRQTDSGKIIPVSQRCGAKITPPCYVPDGDGCAYQIYGDNNDEPIDRCKSCPLCQSDKIRHKQEPVHNNPLTLGELMQMDGKPVWVRHRHGGEWVIVHWNALDIIAGALKDVLFQHEYGETWLAYRQKPAEDTDL